MTADQMRFSDGVTLIEGIFERRIEAVIMSDDAVDGDIGRGVVVLDGGIVLDGIDRVLGNVVSLEGKQLKHGGDGNEDLLVVVGVVAAADRLSHADDGEIGAVDADGLAQHGTPREKQRSGFGGEKGDTARLADIFFIEIAASRDGKVADSRIIGFASGKVAGGAAPLAHFVGVGPGELGGDAADFRQAANVSLVTER